MPETSICGLTDSVRVGPLPDSDPDPTVAPGSARISISSAADDDPVSAWLDNNLNPSVVYERHDSTKETTNPKSNNNNSNPNPKNSRSNSQRFSSSGGGAGGTNLKAEGPIFGLPARIRHVNCSVSRRPPPPSTSGRIFPKKKKPIESEPEPTSPKVSCFGKVSSDRERTTTTKDPDPKPGCLACLFSCGGVRRPKLLEEEDDDDVVEMKSSSTYLNKSGVSVETSTAAAAAPGLGGMKRFSSGRRPASWGGEGDDDFGIDRESVFGRRSVGCLEERGD
ncbi:uncharacterized protein M6B38_351485 [Iris pallida]|uniref:Uncharacterized protein n=1 Tax=Iris pallida TaxID=29817 RepID=A0AAX6GQB9_IRIPA|nr:uncharacterized protein M6B38_351485 [Iris pallida]